MARRRAKSLNKYKKNKKQLGAAAYLLAEYYTGKKPTDPEYETKNNEILKEIDTLKNKMTSCKNADIKWYSNKQGNTDLDPKLNNGGLKWSVSTPRDIPTSLPYPGSKEGIKSQVVPVVGALHELAMTKRHIEGFLGGGGAFVSFPEKMTKNSVAIEWKDSVAAAHKGFIKDLATGESPIQKCYREGYFKDFESFENNEKFIEAEKEGGRSTTNPCDAFISTKVVLRSSYNKDLEDNFRKRINKKGSPTKNRIDNQTELYSRPGVKILNGSFFGYIGDGVINKNGDVVKPKPGDLVYMDPPYLGTESVYSRDKDSKDLSKFAVPENQDTCGDIPNEFEHRKLWEKTAAMYRSKRNVNKGKGVHLAISHSAEGRFHCLIRNAFDKEIRNGDFKACRIDVTREGDKARKYYQLRSNDTSKEQEWLILVSPHAKDVKCDEADIKLFSNKKYGKNEDERVLLNIQSDKISKELCRNDIGQAYLQPRIDEFLDNGDLDGAVKFILGANGNKCPPESNPEWLKKPAKGEGKYGALRKELRQLKKNKQCGN